MLSEQDDRTNLDSSKSERGSRRVFVVRKFNLESKDDEYLALRELRAQVGVEPIQISLDEAARDSGVDLKSLSVPDYGIFSFTWSGDIAALAQSLAFWDIIVYDLDGQPQVTKVAQAAFEDAVVEKTAATLLVAPSFQLSPATRKKNSYLGHNFHKYKAKFFPRLARSLINITSDNADAVVLDPFCGSGTTNLEAALMGHRSIGVDIDPLSVFISRVKCDVIGLSSDGLEERLREEIKRFSATNYQGTFVPNGKVAQFCMPQFLSVRKPKKLPEDAIFAIECDVNRLLVLIDQIDDQFLRDLSRLALSHAIATKISLRWMGTGDDRFALEIGSRSITSVFISQLKMYAEKARIANALMNEGAFHGFVAPELHAASVTNLPVADSSVDCVVTSPPYLPAASGRETYLRSRAASLVALGLMTEAEVLKMEHSIMGSVLATSSLDSQLVPKSVLDLAEWMLPQRARTAKALPTIAYFENLRGALIEIRRVLSTGGRGAMVVSKEHTFWELATRDVVRKFDMAAALSEMIQEPTFGVGMMVEEVINLELPKMDFAARPGARHGYSESIVIFRKV